MAFQRRSLQCSSLKKFSRPFHHGDDAFRMKEVAREGHYRKKEDIMEEEEEKKKRRGGAGQVISA